jgi:hypothetical protein
LILFHCLFRYAIPQRRRVGDGGYGNELPSPAVLHA